MCSTLINNIPILSVGVYKGSMREYSNHLELKWAPIKNKYDRQSLSNICRMSVIHLDPKNKYYAKDAPISFREDAFGGYTFGKVSSFQRHNISYAYIRHRFLQLLYIEYSKPVSVFQKLTIFKLICAYMDEFAYNFNNFFMKKFISKAFHYLNRFDFHPIETHVFRYYEHRFGLITYCNPHDCLVRVMRGCKCERHTAQNEEIRRANGIFPSDLFQIILEYL